MQLGQLLIRRIINSTPSASLFQLGILTTEILIDRVQSIFAEKSGQRSIPDISGEWDTKDSVRGLILG